jgi:ferric-dicitrate binding protein FerR (iron transport regulator)
MTDAEFTRLIERYQQGLATEQEKAALDAWFQSVGNDDELSWTKKDEWAQFNLIRKRIRAANKDREVVPIYPRQWLKIAATILVLLASSYVIWYTAFRNEMLTLTSQTGTSTKAILADGTLVWLKGKSTLQYPKHFDGDQRMVALSGEALFEVTKDASHPFVIRCGNLSAKVLGTSFNLKTGEREIELMVLTGKVELSSATSGNAVVVLPNQKITYNGFPQDEKIPVKEEERSIMLHGTEYDMTFRGATMKDIAERIEKKFNIHVELDGSGVADCLITADFTDQSLDDTFRMIAEILGFTYNIRGGTVTITGGGCG